MFFGFIVIKNFGPTFVIESLWEMDKPFVLHKLINVKFVKN